MCTASSFASDASYIEVLYDSIAEKKPRGKLSWGYSSVISVNGKKMLIDFGKDAKILEHNMKVAGYKWSDFSYAVLSVNEEGHRAGVISLNDAPNLTLYATPDCKKVLSILIPNHKKTIFVKDSVFQLSPEIILFKTYYKGDNVYHESVEEISVLLKTNKGIVLYVGCAIPGIRVIYKKVKELFPNEAFYIMAGGFHLLRWEDDKSVRKLANHLKKDGVKKIAGGHCTGDIAFDVFKEVYGRNYLFLGIDGKVPFGKAEVIKKPGAGFFDKLFSFF